MPPTDSKVATLASTAYGRLRREIIAVEILPGSRLHTRQLCARYDMGLSPIREALSRLSSEGLVRQSDQRGFVVTQLTGADLDALTRTRTWLNEIGLRESITHGDDAWEERVIVSFHRLSRVPRFTEDARNPAWDAAHQTFHAALVAACRSPWLTGYCEQLFDAFERYRNLSAFTAAARPGHVDEHRAIMEATVGRDADQACHLLRQHYELSATLVRKQLSPGDTVMIEQESKNFKLIGHDPSAAFGCGSLVEIRNGHAYVGSVGVDGVEGFTVHDVRDPRNPRKVWEFKAPPGIHMHKLRYVHENLLYVNSERLPGDRGANAQGGFYIFDISVPHTPRQVGFVNMPGSGPHRFGVDNTRHLAFMPSDAPGWDKRVIWTMDIKNPLKPEVVSIWGLPWQKSEGGELGNDPVPGSNTCTLHGPPMIRGDRMFAAFWGGGMAVIDCANLTDMKLLGHVKWSPPFVGCTHTAWPIGNRPYLVVTDEARGKQNYWDSQFMWIVDIRDETNPTPVSTWFPEREKYFNRGGRFGAHNILENVTDEGPWANIVFITYFNAGLRAVDVSDPLRPTEIGCFVPGVADGERAVQSNDIGVDDRGLLYVIDRWGKGMHIVEYTG